MGTARRGPKIGERLPDANEATPGASLAVYFRLGAGEERVVRFILAWHSPQWHSGGHADADEGNLFTHLYAKLYPSCLTAANTLAEGHESLLRRVPAWQDVLYADES